MSSAFSKVWCCGRRILLLFLVCCGLLLLFAGHDDDYLDLLRRYRVETRSLRQEIEALNKKVEDLQNSLKESSPAPHTFCNDEHSSKIPETINEVVPFNYFTLGRAHVVGSGRVVVRPAGHLRKELLEVIGRALGLINSDLTSQNRYTVEDFSEGLYRTESLSGTQYELYFKERNASKTYKRIIVTRPFAHLRTLSPEKVRTAKQLVNFIITLSSNRIASFRTFLDGFAGVALRQDRRVSLTVVYFGHHGLRDVRVLLTRVSREAKFRRRLKLLALNETYSRARGLQAGVTHCASGNGEDVLLLLCAPDVAFRARFLERCRLNAAPGRSVYYPILFNLYGSEIVDPSRQAGAWRDSDFGVSCQYRSDFLGAGGGNDILLYRRHVRGETLRVVRATDPDVFHRSVEKE